MVFSSNLSWSKHIDYIIGKSNKRLGLLKRHKYEWSRSAFEIFYKSYVRPVLEYGDVIYDSCSAADSDRLEVVQLEAARTATGAKRCTSHNALYKELGWQPLYMRRRNNKLIKMYCIEHKLAPIYLQQISNTFHSHPAYPTRGHTFQKFTLPKCNTVFYQNSPFISSMSLWNKQTPKLKELPTKSSFKYHLRMLHQCKPLLFNHNTTRHLQVTFTQIRMGFCNLNNDLFLKGCTDNRNCECGNVKEDARHFFLKCPKYNLLRQTLIANIKSIKNNIHITLPLLLMGSKTLSLQENIGLFNYVYDYIKYTERF
jgi:hypothetical protein